MLNNKHHNLIILWAHPRSCSTAFFRMMVERSDFFCIHEPFCTLYDQKRVSIEINGSEHSFNLVEPLVDFILKITKTKPVFIKETTDHYYEDVINQGQFIGHAKHVFLIRDIATSILSHYMMNPEVKCMEIGYENLHTIYQQVQEKAVVDPMIINAESLIQNPGGVVARFCERTGIPFIPEALQWNPVALPHWKSTGSWHRDVTISSGFRKFEKVPLEKLGKLPLLMNYYNYHRSFYNKLLNMSEI